MPADAYPTTPIVNAGELPDPFTPPEGNRISTRDQWGACARAWADLVVDVEYGGMPPAPDAVSHETLCHNTMKSAPGKPNNWTYRVSCAGGSVPFTFCVRIVFPSGDGPFPAIVTGDQCWWSANRELAKRVVDAGCALVVFNRTEMAEDLGYAGDHDRTARSGGLYEVYPGRTFGALSAWAWGYHRCVDLLHQLPFIDTTRIAVSGHSRGGKTVLLAGATDGRITLINDNGSCAGGSAAFRYVGHGGETSNIANVFPSWFGPKLSRFVGKESDLPFDQHCLLAALAPRPLLLTYALGDRWSNPEGMVQCAWAAGEVYSFLGNPTHIAFHLREGGHAHAPEDWDVLLDFIGHHWFGKDTTARYNQHPYAHLTRAYSWKPPG